MFTVFCNALMCCKSEKACIVLSASVSQTGLCLSYFPLHEEVDGDGICTSFFQWDHASLVHSQSKSSSQHGQLSFQRI